MTGPDEIRETLDIDERHISDDPGQTGYFKALPHASGGWEIFAAVRPGLDPADLDSTVDWIGRSLQQLLQIGPERAGLFPIDDDPARGWHAYCRGHLLPDMSFLDAVDLTEP